MRNKQGLRRFWKRVTIVLSLFVLWMGIFEFVLQVASQQVSAIDRITNRHPPQIQRFLFDEHLGVRGNPQWKEHDLRGFRNQMSLDRATIVTLGDSNTYGLHVSAQHIWPVLIAKEFQRSVYNMGMPNYGPTHNYANLQSALSLHPDLVVLGFYFGNDFYDSFHHVQSGHNLESFTSLTERKAIHGREAQGTIEQQSQSHFRKCRGQGEQEFLGVQATNSIRAYLSAHSRVYGLLRTAKRVMRGSGPREGPFETMVKTIHPQDLSSCSVFVGKNWKTILKAPYRNLAVNDTDIRIRTGIRIAKSFVKRINQEVVEEGADFVVLLLPTKEYVFGSKTMDLTNHREMEDLIQNEARLKAEMIHFFDTEGISIIDVYPKLSQSADQPYFETEDGHPNKIGHRIIADEVIRALERKIVVAQ